MLARGPRLALCTLLVALSPRGASPAWPNSPFTNLAASTAAYDQFNPTIVSAGPGGAVVGGYRRRSGPPPDIYAQHVAASGIVDPTWPANGRAQCTAAGNQGFPTIVSDGAGGAIVTWYDFRSGTNWDI